MKNLKIYENFNSNPIDLDKLKRYAYAIAILCNGEYGDVFYNETTNHIFVNLGDSNPFDDKYLEEYLKDAVTKSYDDSKKIKVTIDNECGPNTNEEGWIRFTFKKGGEAISHEWKGW